jgi:hypothetical protein
MSASGPQRTLVCAAAMSPLSPIRRRADTGDCIAKCPLKGQSEDPRPRPHVGASLAGGRAVKTGRTLALAQAEVFAKTGGQEKPIALLITAFMAVRDATPSTAGVNKRTWHLRTSIFTVSRPGDLHDNATVQALIDNLVLCLVGLHRDLASGARPRRLVALRRFHGRYELMPR